MTQRPLFLVVSSFVLVTACSSSSTSSDAGTTSDSGTTKTDGGAGGDAAASLCGHPGDQGNSLGVGKYCTTLDQCKTNKKATVCATLGGDPSQQFCTTRCSGPDAGADECGE